MPSGIVLKIKRDKISITLVEVLVSIAITIIAVSGIIQFYISSLVLSDLNKEETNVMYHLTAVAEAIKCTSFSNIPVDFPNNLSDGPAGNSYPTLVGGYLLTNEHIVVSYVNPGGNPLEITITLTWKDKRGTNRTRAFVTKVFNGP